MTSVSQFDNGNFHFQIALHRLYHLDSFTLASSLYCTDWSARICSGNGGNVAGLSMNQTLLLLHLKDFFHYTQSVGVNIQHIYTGIKADYVGIMGADIYHTVLG